jgi:hypothetical protein
MPEKKLLDSSEKQEIKRKLTKVQLELERSSKKLASSECIDESIFLKKAITEIKKTLRKLEGI